MKKIFSAATIFLLLPFLAFAQDKQERKLAEVVERLRTAMINGDRAALEDIASEKLSYGHSSGVIENKPEFVEKIASGKSDFVTIDLADQSITVSGKTAIVRHKLSAKTNDGGKPGEVNLLVLLVFQKENKTWKLLARQAVRPPAR